MILILTMFAPMQAAAVTIEKVDITHKKMTYNITFDALVAADPAKAWTLLTDYRQWPRLTDAIIESELLDTFPDARQRVRVSFRFCVLFFCKTVQQVKDMQNDPSGEIYRTEIVSGYGDFASGWEVWEILAERNETRLRYRAEFELTFRLPPLIGPWILKRKFRRELIVMAAKVEELVALR